MLKLLTAAVAALVLSCAASAAAPAYTFCGDRYCPTAEAPHAALAGAPRSAERLRRDRHPSGVERTSRRASHGETGERIVSHPPGCPWRLFCGCGVSVKVFGHPVRGLFLASNWKRFPPASPASGRVAWRDGHVVYIEEVHDDGTVTAYDPNSGGHLTRVHRMSIRGFKVVDPRGARFTLAYSPVETN